MTINAIRTDDSRFENLPGYDFAPHYVDDLKGYEGLRCHYLDEGPADAERTFLCLHGQPTWCYLFRKMIPVFTASGARVVAPDYFGFGRSDKPVEDVTYTFSFHRDMIMAFIEKLDLQSVTLVCQDWGGILGLTIPMDMPERFARLLIMNTALATGRDAGPGFNAWREFCAANPSFDIARLMKRSAPGLTDAEAAAYAAPYQGDEGRAGVRRFPQLVMTAPEMEGVDISKRAVGFWKEQWQGESFMAIGMQDPVVGPPAMAAMRKVIRGCPEPLELAEGGHFVQEHGDIVAEAALKHWGDV